MILHVCYNHESKCFKIINQFINKRIYDLQYTPFQLAYLKFSDQLNYYDAFRQANSNSTNKIDKLWIKSKVTQ